MCTVCDLRWQRSHLCARQIPLTRKSDFLKKSPSPSHPSISDQSFHFICRLHNVLDIFKFTFYIYPLKLQQFPLSTHDDFFLQNFTLSLKIMTLPEMLTPQNQKNAEKTNQTDQIFTFSVEFVSHLPDLQLFTCSVDIFFTFSGPLIFHI